MGNRMQARVAQCVVLFLLVAASLFTAGCSLVTSETEVLGEYELRKGTGKIELNISPGNTFSEIVHWPTGKVESFSGEWSWNDSGISLEKLWIPPAFALDYILEVDSRAHEFSPKQPKYTEPGLWTIRPEKHWGTVILPIFPDDDLNFQMVKQFRR